MVPLVYPNDREAIEAALQTVGLVEPETSGIVQIYDTLELSEVVVSERTWRRLTAATTWISFPGRSTCLSMQRGIWPPFLRTATLKFNQQEPIHVHD